VARTKKCSALLGWRFGHRALASWRQLRDERSKTILQLRGFYVCGVRAPCTSITSLSRHPSLSPRREETPTLPFSGQPTGGQDHRDRACSSSCEGFGALGTDTFPAFLRLGPSHCCRRTRDCVRTMDLSQSESDRSCLSTCYA
jgi:hypothetical protein